MINPSILHLRRIPHRPIHTQPRATPAGPLRLSRLLKHPHRINQPIRLRKRLRIRPHIRLAGRCLLATTRRRPRLARPRAAESGVENDLHVFEMLVDIAAAPAKPRGRSAPLAWVGCAAVLNIGRDAAARPEPDADGLGRPFGGVDATVPGVEGGAKSVGTMARDGAPRVLRLPWRIAVAIRGAGRTGEARFGDRTARAGVEGHLVGRLCVDAFDDVDFAVRGPVGPDEPEGRPGATDAAGHVCDVGDEEAVVEGFLGSDADARPAGGGLGGGVNGHVGCIVGAAGGSYQFTGGGCLVIDVFDEALSRICVCEGGEVAEEGVFGVVIGENIAGYARLN